MTVFMVVEGAEQQGLSIKGILLILILFTSRFLLMFVCFHFPPILPAVSSTLKLYVSTFHQL